MSKKPYGLLVIALAIWFVIALSKASEIRFAISASAETGRVTKWELRDEVVQYDGVDPTQGGSAVKKLIPLVELVLETESNVPAEHRSCFVSGSQDVFGRASAYPRAIAEEKLTAIEKSNRVTVYAMRDSAGLRCSLRRMQIEMPLRIMWVVLSAIVLCLVWVCFPRKLVRGAGTQ